MRKQEWGFLSLFFAFDNDTRHLALANSLVDMMLAYGLLVFITSYLALVEIGDFGLAIFLTYEEV